MSECKAAPAAAADVVLEAVVERDHEGERAPIKKMRSRHNFSWRQISVLEAVFETDPLPWPVSAPPTQIARALRHARPDRARASSALLSALSPRSVGIGRRPPLRIPGRVCGWSSRSAWGSRRGAPRSGSRTAGRSGRPCTRSTARRCRCSTRTQRSRPASTSTWTRCSRPGRPPPRCARAPRGLLRPRPPIARTALSARLPPSERKASRRARPRLRATASDRGRAARAHLTCRDFGLRQTHERARVLIRRARARSPAGRLAHGYRHS
eukprot:3118773-Prymnesium_polylepis.1